MILTTELLLKYKNYLLALEYPFIKEKSDAEIQNLFDNEYRQFLLTWLLTKLIPSYSCKLDEAKKNNKTEQILGNILYENGFCRASEKESFVKGNLNSDTQVFIFDRIFNMLSMLYSNNFIKENMNEKEMSLKHVFMKPSKENFSDSIILDTAISPTVGLKNKLTDKDRLDKLEFLKSEIQRYESILNSQSEANQLEEFEENPSKYSSDEIETCASKFVELINQFKCDDLINSIDADEPKANKKLELENYVSSNSQIMSKILKILEKKNEINILMGNEETINKDTSTNDPTDYYACVLQNYVISGNILQEINRSNEGS